MRDPWDNEFCVLNTEFPQLLPNKNHGPTGQAEPISDPKAEVSGSSPSSPSP